MQQIRSSDFLRYFRNLFFNTFIQWKCHFDRRSFVYRRRFRRTFFDPQQIFIEASEVSFLLIPREWETSFFLIDFEKLKKCELARALF